MKYQNNANKIRQLLLSKIAKAFYDHKLEESINLIPLEIVPKDSKEAFRCCVYKERAIIKHRIMSILGFGAEDDDEVSPCSEYARKAIAREIDNTKTKQLLSVLDIACTGCVDSQYLITNACKGCVARPCTLTCPKKAIKVTKGQALIDYDICVDCGKCMQVCPYHAIIRVPIPCEESCPVGAIGKDEFGKAVIDFNKCIYCGQCTTSCPFGAVMEKSLIIDVLTAIKNKKNVVAMIAPAILGNQFNGNLKQIANAIQQLGFTEVWEVAGGADITAQNETREFAERIHKGDKMMTSSCCPAYTMTVKKHVPELQSFVSTTATPMHYTALAVKNSNPEAITVFIGPCIAKRREAQEDINVDYVLTFEELEALFASKNIDISQCEEIELKNKPSNNGRGFATTCGVTDAILAENNSDLKIRAEFIDGLSKKNIKQLKSYVKNPVNFNFLEVMGCAGGCVGGPCAIGKLPQAQQVIRKIAEKN